MLATNTDDIQELYIGKSPTGAATSGKKGASPQIPSRRDKAVGALAAPQQESVALFFAPTKRYGHIYYVGHWKVIHGELLDPPKIVQEQPRKCWIHFKFVEINPAVTEAMKDR